MKKLTQKQKCRNNKNAIFSQQRRARFKFIQREKNRYKSVLDYLPQKYRKCVLKYRGKKRLTLDLPEYMSLTHNYEETLDFINRYRYLVFKKRTMVNLNFRTLKHISAGAALLFVSELDRWREAYKVRPRVVEIDKWNPIARKYLFQLGFFDILKVLNPPTEEEILLDGEGGQTDFLQFQSKSEVLGDDAVHLKLELEKMSGKTIEAKKQLFKAITEAMTNVSKHAYPVRLKNDPSILYKRWWMTGSFNEKKNSISIIFFDQGVGIPSTLPAKYPKEILFSFLNGLGLNINNDGALIMAAMELGRTQTELSHRGKGLPDVKKYIEVQKSGDLRIISNRGEYKFKAGEKPQIIEHKNSIGGTLIQWDVPL